jgi:hypothetical protein
MDPTPNAPDTGAAGEPTPVVGPVARPPKPRLLQDGRDMFWSLAPLVIGCILLAGIVGMCSFQPGRKNEGAIPPYDVVAALHADAATLSFPIRLPVLPAGWRPNSGGRAGIENGRTGPSGQRLNAAKSSVGYISPTGMYLSLTQSNADEEKLVASIHSAAFPTGAVDVAGTNWVVYQEAGQTGSAGEPIWITTLTSPAGRTQIAITGAGSPDEFRTLASATQSQPPLPARPPAR